MGRCFQVGDKLQTLTVGYYLYNGPDEWDYIPKWPGNVYAFSHYKYKTRDVLAGRDKDELTYIPSSANLSLFNIRHIWLKEHTT